jgi:hypothetical protein
MPLNPNWRTAMPLPIELAQAIPDFPWAQIERGGFIAILIWIQRCHETRVDRLSSAHLTAWEKAMDSYQDTLERLTTAHATLVELVRRGRD